MKKLIRKLKSLEKNSNETLDLIPIGAFRGKGIKNTKKFASFLMAFYNPIDESFHSICKVGTGFNTMELQDLFEKLNTNALEKPKENYVIPPQIKPDCFFDLKEIWEIGFDKFSESGVYLTYLNPMEFTGVSLRFPRFIRRRTDKNILQSSDISYINNLIEKTFKK